MTERYPRLRQNIPKWSQVIFRKENIKYVLITWIAAVVMTVGASILHSDMFMMASAGVLVVSSIALSAIGLTFIINKLFVMKAKSMDQA